MHFTTCNFISSEMDSSHSAIIIILIRFEAISGNIYT